MTLKHDTHYASMAIEPIDVMEQRMKPSDIAEFPDTIQRMHLAIALSYIMRAGLKEGQSWEKDVEKAQNHLHRALKGKWIDD